MDAKVRKTLAPYVVPAAAGGLDDLAFPPRRFGFDFRSALADETVAPVDKGEKASSSTSPCDP